MRCEAGRERGAGCAPSRWMMGRWLCTKGMGGWRADDTRFAEETFRLHEQATGGGAIAARHDWHQVSYTAFFDVRIEISKKSSLPSGPVAPPKRQVTALAPPRHRRKACHHKRRTWGPVWQFRQPKDNRTAQLARSGRPDVVRLSSLRSCPLLGSLPRSAIQLFWHPTDIAETTDSVCMPA